MGFGNFGIWEMLVIGLFVLIFFGPQRMPEIARSLGKAMREFKKGVNEIQRELEVADRDTRQATRTTWQPPSSTTPKTAEEATGPVPEDLSIQPPPSPDYPAATAAVAGDAATEPVPVSTHRPPVTDVESESAIRGRIPDRRWRPLRRWRTSRRRRILRGRIPERGRSKSLMRLTTHRPTCFGETPRTDDAGPRRVAPRYAVYKP
jgi:sec-independent protein translocase protein TatA